MAREAAADELSMRPDRPLVMARTLNLPGTTGRLSLLDQLAPTAVSAIDDSASFADVDPERLSISGESSLLTEWRIEGLAVTSAFFDGAAFVRVPRALTATLAISAPEAGGPNVDVSLEGSGTFARVAAQGGDLGGMAPFAREVLATFSGAHALDRGVAPLLDRRHRDGVSLGLGAETSAGGQPAHLALEVDGGRRFFPGLLGDPFVEQTLTLDGGLLAGPPRRRVAVLVSHRDQTHGFASLLRTADETARLARSSIFAALIGPHAALGLGVGHVSENARAPEATTELLDGDGLGLRPELFSGGATELLVSAHAEDASGLYARAAGRGMALRPSLERWTHRTTIASRPNGRVELSRAPSFVGGLSIRAGARARLEARGVSFALDGFGSANAGVAGGRSILLPDVGATVSIESPRLGPFGFYGSATRAPIGLTTELLRAIDPNGLSRSTFAGDVRVSREGGAYTRVDPSLRSPLAWMSVLGLRAELSDSFVVEVSGSLRRLVSLPEIVLDGDPRIYGDFVDEIYFFRPGNETRWVLKTSERASTYFAGNLQLRTGLDARWFFSLSFSALSSVGYPPLGNGPDANDVLAPIPRDPSSELFGFASLDADRAFVTKLWVAARLTGEGPVDAKSEGLIASLALSHRDGQPFAFIDTHVRGDQVSRTLASNRGSPLSYSRPLLGPREDFQLTADAVVAYGFDAGIGHAIASIVVGNLWDLGTEIVEGHDSIRRPERAAIELGIPRSVMISLELR
ncbi:MAG: hypothetical protein HYV07_06135 [Deltaproteobacteria bacterium]|nr:hypothetical protein [Deltaproteobacteria bacterium]